MKGKSGPCKIDSRSSRKIFKLPLVLDGIRTQDPAQRTNPNSYIPRPTTLSAEANAMKNDEPDTYMGTGSLVTMDEKVIVYMQRKRD